MGSMLGEQSDESVDLQKAAAVICQQKWIVPKINLPAADDFSVIFLALLLTRLPECPVIPLHMRSWKESHVILG